MLPSNKNLNYVRRRICDMWTAKKTFYFWMRFHKSSLLIHCAIAKVSFFIGWPSYWMAMCQHCHQYYAYVICQMTYKRIHFCHIVKDIIINASYRNSSSSPVVCFICIVYDIAYQILNVSSQIYYLTMAKVSVSLSLDKKWFLSQNINAQLKIWNNTWMFDTYVYIRYGPVLTQRG